MGINDQIPSCYRGDPLIGGPSAHTVQSGPCWTRCHGDPVPHVALPDHGVQAVGVWSLLPGPVHKAGGPSPEECPWTGEAASTYCQVMKV